MYPDTYSRVCIFPEWSSQDILHCNLNSFKTKVDLAPDLFLEPFCCIRSFWDLGSHTWHIYQIIRYWLITYNVNNLSLFKKFVHLLTQKTNNSSKLSSSLKVIENYSNCINRQNIRTFFRFFILQDGAT